MKKLLAKQLAAMPHRQLLVYRPDAESPFSRWTPAHHAQGFILREEAVAFNTADVVEAEIAVYLADDFEPLRSAVTIIALPFATTGEVIVGTTVGEVFRIELPAGTYQLYFEMTAPKGDRIGIRLTCTRSAKPKATVLRSASPVVEPLLLTGEPM